MTDTITVRIDGSEPMLLTVTGANYYVLSRIDTAVRSCRVVNKKHTGWSTNIVSKRLATYRVVFKRSAHVGQHMTRIEELIKQAVPGINITFT